MSELKALLAAFRQIADDPAGAVARHRKETGKGAVGVLPVYAPEELVHATGFLPVGIWGGHTGISKARAYLPAFACSIMQSIMEFELNGLYNDLAAVVISSPCDTLKCFGQKWKGSCPAIQFAHPQNRGLESANTYLVEEYRMVRAKLEQATGAAITDEAVRNSIRIYNENRAELRRFTELAGKHPRLVSPSERHAVVKARYFMDKGRHTAALREVNALLEDAPVQAWDGKRVVLTGIMAEPYELLDLLAENHFAVAGDDLAQESRQFRHDVPEEDADPLLCLARWWQRLEGCSLATDRKKGRMDMLCRMAEETRADAVVFCMMKFCDPEEFDYPLIQKRLQQQGIPSLYLEIDQESTSFEQASTRILSFAEMLA